MEPYSPDVLWIVIVGFVLSTLLAFAIGANDVANSFGTSVGSKVLTLRQAFFLATVFEIAGSVLIGYKVSDTVRKGIFNVSMYEGSEKELMLGSLSALTGSAIWQFIATFFKLPVSGTHSIVGATIGFTVVARGTHGIQWIMLAKIVGSWFISPILSGIISAVFFSFILKFIINKKDSITPGLKFLPFVYGFTLLVNVFSIVNDGPALLYLDRVPLWGSIVISLGVGLVAALVVQFALVPWMRRRMAGVARTNEVRFTFGSLSAEVSQNPTPERSRAISLEELPISVVSESGLDAFDGKTALDQEEVTEFTNGHVKLDHEPLASHRHSDVDTTKKRAQIPSLVVCPSAASVGIKSNSSLLPLVEKSSALEQIDEEGLEKEVAQDADKPEVGKLFSFLQILTAIFGSFAHGGNDVSNAIGPLIALWLVYHEGSVEQTTETPLYILVFGGVGISLGLWVWGKRVIETVGKDLTKITPSSGFTIEIGAAFTVLVASKVGLPISTTHCKVGSVVFVGWVKSSKSGVDWSLFRNIVIAWVVTVPFTAFCSAAVMATLRAVAL